MRENCYGDEILEKFDLFSTEKATVWIDPLDGTKDFCNGNLSAVTVLVGLAIDGVPKKLPLTHFHAWSIWSANSNRLIPTT